MLLIGIILRMYLKDQKVESRCLFHKSYESQVFCFAKKGKCFELFYHFVLRFMLQISFTRVNKKLFSNPHC